MQSDNQNRVNRQVLLVKRPQGTPTLDDTRCYFCAENIITGAFRHPLLSIANLFIVIVECFNSK